MPANSDSIRGSAADSYQHRNTSKIGGAAIAVTLHVIVIALLLQLQPVRSALTDAAPILVRLVSPAPEHEPKPDAPPKPLPVKPRAQRIKPVEAPPIVAAVTEQSTPFVAPPPPPAPAAPAEPVVSSPPAPSVIAAPVPVTPPNFDADYLNNPPPAYPAMSRRTGEEGKVVLRVFVSEQGLPTQVQVRTSSGHGRLDEAALNTVRQWRFVPARRGESPVGAWVLVPISFVLRS